MFGKGKSTEPSVPTFSKYLEVLPLRQLSSICLNLLLWYENGSDFTSFTSSKTELSKDFLNMGEFLES